MKTQIKNRQSNFELLRIVSMFMIVLHHAVIHGVMQSIKGVTFSSLWLSGSSINKFFTWLYFPGGEVGVALFFMLTGYFLINSKEIRLFKVIMQTVFYGWMTSFVYLFVIFLVKYDVIPYPYPFFSQTDIKNGFLYNIFSPLRSGQFWFVTSYILLLCFTPIYNVFLNKLNKKGYTIFLLLFWFFGLVYSTYFNIALGVTKALFFYAFGTYIKKYSTKIKSNSFKLLMLITSMIVWFLYAANRFYLMNTNSGGGIVMKILNLEQAIIPSCFCVIIIAYLLFIFFMSIDFGCNKFVNTLAATTFGVYLIHEGFFTRGLIWDFIIGVYSKLYHSNLFGLYIFIGSIIVFSVCSFLDYLRLKIIEPLVLRAKDMVYIMIKRRFFNEEQGE